MPKRAKNSLELTKFYQNVLQVEPVKLYPKKELGSSSKITDLRY